MALSDFERGVRVGIDAHDLYFRDEDERSISTDHSDDDLESFKAGALQDALADENRTN